MLITLINTDLNDRIKLSLGSRIQFPVTNPKPVTDEAISTALPIAEKITEKVKQHQELTVHEQKRLWCLELSAAQGQVDLFSFFWKICATTNKPLQRAFWHDFAELDLPLELRCRIGETCVDAELRALTTHQ